MYLQVCFTAEALFVLRPGNKPPSPTSCVLCVLSASHSCLCTLYLWKLTSLLLRWPQRQGSFGQCEAHGPLPRQQGTLISHRGPTVASNPWVLEDGVTASSIMTEITGMTPCH